jgi:hypothetical protein
MRYVFETTELKIEAKAHIAGNVTLLVSMFTEQTI